MERTWDHSRRYDDDDSYPRVFTTRRPRIFDSCTPLTTRPRIRVAGEGSEASGESLSGPETVPTVTTLRLLTTGPVEEVVQIIDVCFC